MGHEEEVMRIGKRLEKISAKKESAANALDLLNVLKSIHMDLDVLQKTRIGMIVNQLRKSVNDEEVISLSRGLIKKWKKLVEAQKDAPNASKPDQDGSKYSNNGISSTDNGKHTSSNGSSSGNHGSNGNSRPSAAVTDSKPASKFGERPKLSFPSLDTSDSIRLKCREMLTNALNTEFVGDIDVKDEILEDPTNLAAKIEDCIFKEFKSTNDKYKNRIRSRVANLKDNKNPDLRLNVLRGEIDVARIATMTADEMASAEMKLLRQKFTKEAINNAQMAVTSGTKTDQIPCPKCKKNNVTYNQMQTRSSDEPMTTFCFCNECGKRWKFC